ncbi:nucleoporin NDC1 [Strongylocentrotus purpuratus]|uniref:Nucleoporin NDC1 n=1 Tax=Strongylocentrotus purpuratus TaxID=7668 RepID=A0A7M7RAU8_STRPU|nr:nucleoporin NDC1 [Strongylocentrotus purpuratus]
MASNKDWYMKDVFHWRTGASIAWSMLLLPPALGVYICLAHFSLLHPTAWLIGWIRTCFSFHGMSCIFLVLLCSLFAGFSNAMSYIAVPYIHRNRVSIILSVTRPPRLLHAAGHALLGGVTAWSCCKLIGGSYQELSTRCNGEESGLCLNERHLFLVLFGAFLGAVYSVAYFLHRQNLLTFNIIQQVKFFQVKSSVPQSVLKNSVWALRLCAYYFAFYYLCGCLFKSWLLTNLQLQELPIPVDSIRGLLDVRLLWQAWLVGTIITHLWTFSLYLFKVFNTEVYEFPIETAFSTSEECTLYRALGQQNSPLVKYLAYQDLSILAEHSPARRKQIFTLSQPGGHPHNWTRISSECLALIASLTDRLIVHQEWAANGINREKRMQIEEEKKKKKNQSGKDTQRASSSTSFYSTATSPGPHQRIATLSATPYGTPADYPAPGYGTPRTPARHNASYSAVTPGRGDSVWVDSPGSQSYVPSTRRPIHEQYSGMSPQRPPYLSFRRPFVFLQPRIAVIRQLPLYRYFVDPFPEADNRLLFTDTQLHIWALEALASLVAASYTEDSYGVVQKSLPDILTEMLALYNALEKLLKLPTLLTARDPRELKVTRIGPAHPDDQLRNDLRTTVKTSLHRISSTFSKHLKSVPLALEYKKQLDELMDYKI